VTDTDPIEEPPGGAGDAAAPGQTVHGCPARRDGGQEVVFATAETYGTLMAALADEGYEVCVDLCAVDYLGHPGRTLPDGIGSERFEVVVNLLDLDRPARIRVRAQVPEHDPALPSLFDLWPGTEAMEREAFDMVGVRFHGHPDLTRILMPEDWDGHPLRKDYEQGRIPVQFNGAPEAR
jgi:NADH-quinone oxidoreductase subunit C